MGKIRTRERFNSAALAKLVPSTRLSHHIPFGRLELPTPKGLVFKTNAFTSSAKRFILLIKIIPSIKIKRTKANLKRKLVLIFFLN